MSAKENFSSMPVDSSLDTLRDFSVEYEKYKVNINYS